MQLYAPTQLEGLGQPVCWQLTYNIQVIFASFVDILACKCTWGYWKINLLLILGSYLKALLTLCTGGKRGSVLGPKGAVAGGEPGMLFCVKSTYFRYSGPIWNNWNCWLCARKESWGQFWAQGWGDHWWGTWDNRPLPGTPGWGKELRSGEGTTVDFLPWFKAAFFLYRVVHGGYVESRTGYTCSRTHSFQTILRS